MSRLDVEGLDLGVVGEAVAEGGLSTEAQQHAKAALLALGDTGLKKVTQGQKHIMLSCEHIVAWLRGCCVRLR